MNEDNRRALYVRSGDDFFLIVLDSNTNKEMSRALIPTITFEEAEKFGIADHRITIK